MTYSPSRITKKDFETEEIEINGNLIQKNLDLIAKETKELQNQINANLTSGTQTAKILGGQTKFVNAFLFG